MKNGISNPCPQWLLNVQQIKALQQSQKKQSVTLPNPWLHPIKMVFGCQDIISYEWDPSYYSTSSVHNKFVLFDLL